MREVILCRDADWTRFEAIAEYLCDRCGCVRAVRADGVEQRYWDLDFGGTTLTLHLEHYLGISLYLMDASSSSLLETLVDELRRAGLATVVAPTDVLGRRTLQDGMQ